MGGSFTVQVHATDPLAGLDRLTFPAATAASSKVFDYAGETDVYRSRVYAFDAGDTFSGDVSVEAVDRAGNAGTTTFTVLRDAVPPVVTAQAVPDDEGGVDVSWSATDEGAGVSHYDLDVSVDGGAWQRVLTNTQSTDTHYPGELGHSYAFRVTATAPLRCASGVLR